MQAVIAAARALGRDETAGTPAVAATVRIPQAANRQPSRTSPDCTTTAAGMTGSEIVGLAGTGSSMTALRAARRGSAATRPSSTRAARTFQADSRDSDATEPSASTLLAPIDDTETQLARQVEDAIIGATIDNDELLPWALRHGRADLRRNAEESESDRAAITRLAVRFLDITQPRASARDAILGLAREDWDLGEALASWYDDNGDDEEDGNHDNDEGQPPRKKRRFDDRGEDGGDEKGKGKGKGKGKAN